MGWRGYDTKYTIRRRWPFSEAKGINAMATLKTEEEEIVTFDVSDEALEIVGTVGDKNHFTWGICTVDQSGCPA